MNDRTAEGVLPVLLQLLDSEQHALVAGALVIYRDTSTGVTTRARRLPLV
jgi:hypothetical protein